MRTPIRVLVLLIATVSSLQPQTSASTRRPRGQALQVSPSSLAYGSVQMGDSSSKTLTVKNASGQTLTLASVIPSSPAFRTSGFTVPKNMAPGSSVTVNVTFAPTAAGSVSASLTFSTSGNLRAAARVPLSGTGVGVTAANLSVSPARLSFGNVTVGTTATLPATISNLGNAGATISQSSVTGSNFSLDGLTLPMTLSAGQGVTFNLHYAPAAAGSSNGVVALTTNSPSGTLSINLSGAGVAAAAPNLSVNPASVNFGNVTVGSAATIPATISNSGTASATISQSSVTGGNFSLDGLTLPMTLNPGQGVTFNLHYAPTAAGSSSGAAALTTNSPQGTLKMSLAGAGITAGGLTASPSSLSFGSVQVGNQAANNVTLTNAGGQAVNVLQASTSGSGFSTSGLSLPLALTPTQKFTFRVTFAPTASGSASANLSLTSDGSNPNLAIALSGTGTAPGQLGATASLDFGSVVVGSSKSLSASLSASGADVVVTAINVSNSEFAYNGLTLPATIKAGQTQPFNLTFSPRASGATTASVAFTSNAASSATESLAGTGTAAVAHSVDLSWTAPTSSVAGYNVYRGGVSGGPYTKINPSIDSAVTFTDSSVQAGQTYFYTVTAVDGTGSESARSNEVQAVIPAP